MIICANCCPDYLTEIELLDEFSLKKKTLNLNEFSGSWNI